jgi:hypothetical protein
MIKAIKDAPREYTIMLIWKLNQRLSEASKGWYNIINTVRKRNRVIAP